MLGTIELVPGAGVWGLSGIRLCMLYFHVSPTSERRWASQCTVSFFSLVVRIATVFRDVLAISVACRFSD